MHGVPRRPAGGHLGFLSCSRGEFVADFAISCMILFFSVQIHPSCIDGFCGRAFMRLALGEETECVADVAVACDLDLDNVVSHVHALPDEAKKLLLFWIGEDPVS